MISPHYSAVFEALDDAVASSTCLASSEARIQRALVHFRSRDADPLALSQLEQASVELHRLSLAKLANRQDERTAAPLTSFRQARRSGQ
jgi:hypothetical protein